MTPPRLLVVGAASGMGRWWCEHVLAQQSWESVALVDLEPKGELLAEVAGWFAGPVSTSPTVPEESLPAGSVALLAVPPARLGAALAPLASVLAPGSTLLVNALGFGAAARAVSGAGVRADAHLVHALFDASAPSPDGQTVCISSLGSASPAWLRRVLTDLGAIPLHLGPDKHDEVMGYVQALTHQTLVAFARAVTDSGLDLAEELWPARTPLFESLFGLAARALDEGQQRSHGELQRLLAGQDLNAALETALAEVGRTLPDEFDDAIRTTRDRFSGALYQTVRGTADASVRAAQSTRTRLAEHWRNGTLVGIRDLRRPDRVRVGRLVDVSPTQLTLHEVLAGEKGRAGLLEGPGAQNHVRLGIGGKPRVTTFGIGRIDVLSEDELQLALEEWLASVSLDVRFLVPESVAGAGVVASVEGRPGVRRAEVVSEVVRTGQRSVVVRVEVRADQEVGAVVEDLRGRVEATYAWPSGVSRRVETSGLAICFLGPRGTFSEIAAHRLGASIGAADAPLLERDSFDDVIASITERTLGVLPISSSASGLVQRTTAALLAATTPLAVGGMVDVPVRFDAFTPDHVRLDELRGAAVYSHPQALLQCSRFIERWGLTQVECASTSEALDRLLAAEAPGVALASGVPAPPGLHVAEREVDDLSGSITRFLIVGSATSFSAPTDGSDPTLRSVAVARHLDSVLPHLQGGAALDELLTGADGSCLWVTSRVLGPELSSEVGGDVRLLGRVPWSPRTPLVRASASDS
jgi:prephenate dehydratase/prephenate dehydrogenase/ferredoxin-fold anticodon binding domain-containing protein